MIVAIIFIIIGGVIGFFYSHGSQSSQNYPLLNSSYSSLKSNYSSLKLRVLYIKFIIFVFGKTI